MFGDITDMTPKLLLDFSLFCMFHSFFQPLCGSVCIFGKKPCFCLEMKEKPNERYITRNQLQPDLLV